MGTDYSLTGAIGGGSGGLTISIGKPQASQPQYIEPNTPSQTTSMPAGSKNLGMFVLVAIAVLFLFK